MGFAITWFAVPEARAASFLRRLSLVETGETEEFPESLIATARMDTGWQVLWYNKYVCKFLRTDTVREISLEHDVLVCAVEEHSMGSSASLWRGGSRVWHLDHDGSGGPKGRALKAEGALPECFAGIRDEMERAQKEEGGATADVDMLFEIPLRVAQALIGFKHDEDSSHVMGGKFYVLRRDATDAVTSSSMPALPRRPAAASPRPGFFRRLFGAKSNGG
ncbi:MAG: hypothetical protein ACO1TE_15560 [Prosthecobacter sp.]